MITGDGDPEQLRIGWVTSNFFRTLGVNPAIGRTFEDSDEGEKAFPSILLNWAEMGIRMALGATVQNVLSMIFREAFAMAATGVILGVIGARAAAHWLASLLYGTSPGVLPSYLVALVLLPAAALLGCRRPEQRAASANPADTIREE